MINLTIHQTHVGAMQSANTCATRATTLPIASPAHHPINPRAKMGKAMGDGVLGNGEGFSPSPGPYDTCAVHDPDFHIKTTPIGAMQSANACATPATTLPIASPASHRTNIRAKTGQAMGDGVLVNGDGFGPSPGPCDTCAVHGPDFHIKITPVGAMQSANAPATRATTLPIASPAIHRTNIRAKTGQAMGDGVLVNGDGFGPSPGPYDTYAVHGPDFHIKITPVGAMQSANAPAIRTTTLPIASPAHHRINPRAKMGKAMGDGVLVNGDGYGETGKAMGDGVLVNGDGYGPSPGPYGGRLYRTNDGGK